MNSTAIRSGSGSNAPVLSRVSRVLKTAFPIFLNYESIALIGLVDIQLAGSLGTAAQTAVGLGDQLLYLTSTAASGLSVATCAITARYYGAMKLHKLAGAIKVSLIASTICGALAMVLGLCASTFFVELFSNDPAVIEHGAGYIQLCAFGSLPFVVSIVISSIFRSLNKVIYSLHVWLTTAAVTILLSYTFFYVENPLAHSLGALCAAWDIGAFAGLLVGASLLKKLSRELNIVNRSAPDQRRLFKLIILMGSAIAIAESSTLLSDFLIYKVISFMPEPTNMQAAWTIFLKVEESFAIMPISAIALALAASVGQLIGKGFTNQARTCTALLVIASAVLFTIFGALMLMFPEALQSMAHAETAVVSGSLTLLAMIPIFFPLLAIRILLFAFLEGSGQTEAPMKLALFGNAIKIVLAVLLALVCTMGLSGLSIALLVSRLCLTAGSIHAFLQRRLNQT